MTEPEPNEVRAEIESALRRNGTEACARRAEAREAGAPLQGQTGRVKMGLRGENQCGSGDCPGRESKADEGGPE